MHKNGFESMKTAIFEEVVHIFGRSDDDLISKKKCLFSIYADVVHAQLDQKILNGI